MSFVLGVFNYKCFKWGFSVWWKRFSRKLIIVRICVSNLFTSSSEFNIEICVIPYIHEHTPFVCTPPRELDKWGAVYEGHIHVNKMIFITNGSMSSLLLILKYIQWPRKSLCKDKFSSFQLFNQLPTASSLSWMYERERGSKKSMLL